jgi:hypothetical protein
MSRPVSSVVIIVVDALKREVFYNMLADGELPGFAEAFADGAKVRFGSTVYPTETLPAQTSLFTGLEVRRHGIVGNGWVERSPAPARALDFTSADTAAGVFGYKLFGWPTLLLPMKNPAGLINDSLYPPARTIYEIAAEHGLNSAVIFNQVSRGANRWVRPNRGDMIYFALSSKGLLDFKLIDLRTWLAAASDIRRNGLPNIFTLYFSGLDAWCHHTGAAGQAAYLKEAVDPHISSLVRLLEKSGARDSTRLVLCSDHGQTWLQSSNMITTGALREALEARGFRASLGSKLLPGRNCHVSIIGGCAQFYAANGASGVWGDPPDFERDILPLAEAVDSACRGDASSGRQDSNSIILVRAAPGSGYSIFKRGSLSSPDEFFWDKLDRFPRAIDNIRGLDCPRSGDVVLFSASDQGCYISDNPDARTHGGLSPDNAGIPIIFSGPGVPRRVIEQASIIDIAPTVLSFFNISVPGMDGSAIKF